MPAKKDASFSTNRRERIVLTATEVFLRYGFARATLGDIAEAAGISRPALYLVFPGKEEIFAAVLRTLVEDQITRYRAALPRFKTLKNRLLYCTEQWVLAGYRMTASHPDARDAFNMAYPAVRDMYDVITSFFAELLQDAVAASPLPISAKELASMHIFSLRGMKELAGSEEMMQRIIAHQVQLVLAALGRRQTTTGD